MKPNKLQYVAARSLPLLCGSAALFILPVVVTAQPDQTDFQRFATPGTSTITITVERAGTARFQELADRQGIEQNTTKRPEVVPYMPPPPPREIGETLLPTPGQPQQREASEQPLSDAQPLGPTPNPAFGFLALEDNNTVIPPDTMGAVGPRHLMTMLNTQVRIQDKAGTILGTISLDSFWTDSTGLSGDPFDPKVIFDPLSKRWMATVDANARSTDSQVWFAISQTDDPTGAWDFFGFMADDGEAGVNIWSDYPGLGVNKNWIAITNNMFRVFSGGGSEGAKMWVIDKATALAEGSLGVVVFPAGFDFSGGVAGFTLQPALTFDASEEKLYIVDNTGWSTEGTHMVRISEITGTGSAPNWSVTPDAAGPFPGTGLFLVANNFNFIQIDASQLGTTQRVATNDPRMLNAVFRNGRIWGTHSGGLPASGLADRTAVFWYQLNPAALNDTGNPIVQSGVLDGGADVHHFFPSIAVNKDDEAYVGFSRSDATRYVEAVGTGRSAGDTSGSMDPIVVLKAGEDSYVKDLDSGVIRWGDYSATAVDPIDDVSFWTIQEYAAPDVGTDPNDDRWGTWWACIGPCTGEVNSPIAVGLGGPAGEGWLEIMAGQSPHDNEAWVQVDFAVYNAAAGATQPVFCNVDDDDGNELVIGLGTYTASGGWLEVKDDDYSHLAWVQVDWPAYNAANGATHPACGDLDGDGRDEIVVGLGTDGNGWLNVRDDATVSYADLGWTQVPWAEYNTANGTTYPAVGNLDEDERAEIVVGLGTYSANGGWLHIKDDAAASYADLGWTQVPWAEYNAANGATHPAVGNLDEDERAEIVVGLGTYSANGGWLHIKDDAAANYANLGWTQVPWAEYNAANGATYPAVGNLDGDERAEVVVGLGAYPANGGWLEFKDDDLSHLSWGRVHWESYNAADGMTRPDVGGAAP